MKYFNTLFMRIYAKVIPGCSRSEVEKISDQEYKIKVTASPEKGKANEAVREALAEFFKVKKASVEIIAGKTARRKIIDVII